ncbi:uncharacterized protein LOC129895555 [Solanum dulcamara]|uniref:uncharacterized protein LOC129895555 n=1 Tax=Solanum dulcamara TaxID=45834 RepID=UPI0024867751|nr:uncharacterized protein LOC129895555 [Solanum dulcamara]
MSALPSPEDGGEMSAQDNVGSKRYRRPSVRLGDIGGELSSFDQRKSKSLWKDSSSKNNRHRTNLSSNQTLTLVDTNPNESSNSRKNWSNVDEEDIGDANLDDVIIGSWKIRNLKSNKGPVTKKMRSGWTPKVDDSEKDDKMLSTDVEDLDNNENSGHSPVHSHDNNKTNDNVNMGTIDIDRRIDNVNSRKRAIRVSQDGPTDTEARDWKRNGVKVWLDQLGLGQYASLFEIHEVDDEVLPMLTLEDLKDMGITAVGSRRKMYCSIQNLNKGFS